MSESYGYWITHKGELLEVDHEDHYGVADKYVLRHYYKQFFDYVTQEDDPDSDFGPPDVKSFVSKRLGWIRLVNEGYMLGINYEAKALSLASYRALVKYINENNYDRYNLDISTNNLYKFKAYSELEEGKRFKDKMLMDVKKNVDASKVIANTDPYGYWFTDKGEQLEVGRYQHDTVAEELVRKNYSDLLWAYVEEKGYKGTNNLNFKQFAMEQLGWIRWVNEPKDQSISVNIAPNVVAPKAFKTFSKYLDTCVFKSIRLDIEKNLKLPLVEYDNNSKPVVSAVYKNIKPGGSMNKQSVIKARVHATIIANEAERRMVVYTRIKNGKKV